MTFKQIDNKLFAFIGYVTSTLEDARIYATHANKKMIDVEDVQLAVQMQLDKNFTTPPPRDVSITVRVIRKLILMKEFKDFAEI